MSRRNIKCWVQAEIHPDSAQLAEIFLAMDAEEQAGFFNYLGATPGLPQQMGVVASDQHLTEDGRFAMNVIGGRALVAHNAALLAELEKRG